MTILIPSYSRLRSLLLILFVAGVYFGLARVSLQLAFQSSNATPVWPPSGFAFAAILLLGSRIVPGILLGAFAANLVVFLANHTIDTATAVWASALIGIGNTAEAFTGFYLFNKLMPADTKSFYFQRVHLVSRFVYTTLLICLVSCTIGSITVFLAGLVPHYQFLTVWFTWWTGDVTGIFLITPLLLVWSTGQWINEFRGNVHKLAEGAALFAGVVFMSGIVFEIWVRPPFIFTHAVWIIPFLIWAAVRFHQRVVVTVVIVSAIIAFYGTINNLGPFVTASLNESLLTVQTFISINCVTALLLNAALREREHTETSLRAARNNLEILIQERTAALSASNQQLAEAQRLAHIGSWEWNVQTNRITWSDELYRIFGLAPETFEPTYENYLHCSHPDDRDYVNEIVQRCLGDHRPFEFYHRIVSPGGAIRIIHGQGEVVTDTNGAIVKMTGTGQDVTERKLAEDMLLKTTRELEQKNRELVRSNIELASFSYVASHDLQEPLRKIKMFADRILTIDHENLSDTGKDYFHRIQSAAERMKLLIENLLSYSRVNTAEKLFEETDLNQLLQEVKNDLSESIQQKQAVIESYALPPIKVIPYQFRQLFTNFISNSLKFSKPGTRPHIVIKAEIVNNGHAMVPGNGLLKKYYHLSISDNGIGFDPAYKEKIFAIFQRLHGAKEYAGTGIGLAICKKIIENHHGMITASSEINKGATFHIYLPLATVDQVEVQELGSA